MHFMPILPSILGIHHRSKTEISVLASLPIMSLNPLICTKKKEEERKMGEPYASPMWHPCKPHSSWMKVVHK